MDFALIFGKNRRDFLATDQVRQVVCLNAASQGVMIRERHKIHACAFEELMGFDGVGHACRELELSEQPIGGTRTVPGMDVEISA